MPRIVASDVARLLDEISLVRVVELSGLTLRRHPADPAAGAAAAAFGGRAGGDTGGGSSGGCGGFGQILITIMAIAIDLAINTVLPGAGVALAVEQIGAAAASDAIAQGIGVATGLEDKFDWTQVGISALTAGVTEGVNAAPFIGADVLKGIGGAVVRGAVGNVITQGVELATGVEKRFDWAGVAVSAVSSGVIRTVGGAIDPNFGSKDLNTPLGFAGAFAGGLAGSVAGAATRTALTGSDFSQNLLTDLPGVIGNTIGNAIAGNVESQSSTDGQSQNPLQALWGGIKQIGGEIVGGVEQVGGAIVNGVETGANDVGHGLESVFNLAPATATVQGNDGVAYASTLGTINLTGGSLDNGVYYPGASGLGGSLIDITNTNVVGPNGYVPQPGDQALLARMIYAESSSTPKDDTAIGWSIVNRVNAQANWQTLNAVLTDPNGFQIVPEGGSQAGGSPQWQASAKPQNLTGANAASWAAASATAQGIFNGSISDPTGAATYFFSSSHYDPANPALTAPSKWYGSVIANQTLLPSTYVGHSYVTARGNTVTNYFFVEAK